MQIYKSLDRWDDVENVLVVQAEIYCTFHE